MWKTKWNKSFPLRLAMRTGVYLAIVLLLITLGSYVSMAWLLGNSADDTLVTKANSMITQWSSSGQLDPMQWHDLSYRVLLPNGQTLADMRNGHDVHDVHEQREHAPWQLPDGPQPLLYTRSADGQKALSQTAALVNELLPIQHTERVAVVPFFLQHAPLYLEVSQHTDQTQGFLLKILPIFIVIAASGFLLILRVILKSTKKGFEPVEQITAMLKTVQESTLSTRLEVPARDETLDEMVHVLNVMLDRLEHAFQAQSRFVQDASHELRTPLAVLRSDIEITMRKPRSAEEYRENLQRCLEEVEHMSHLTQQLLTLARYDQSRKMDMHEVNLQDVIGRVFSKVEATQNLEQIELSSEPDEPFFVRGEPVALEMLFSNLVQNAIRAIEGAGTVRISLRQTDDAVLVDVADTGIGIPSEALPMLFDRLYRVDDARNRQTGGTGLGLAICESIVKAHHGTIRVTSRVGVGTTFSVTLPK